MKKALSTNKQILLLLAIVFVVFVFVSLFVTGNLSLTGSSSNFFSDVEVSTTSEDEVKGTLGEPEKEEVDGNSKSLIYGSEFEVPKNTVVLENDQVKYYIESVFSEQEGELQLYINQYGEPDILLDDIESEDHVWNIFLGDGVGIASSAYGHVGKIIKFDPVSKEVFMETIAPDIERSADQVHEEPIPVLE